MTKEEIIQLLEEEYLTKIMGFCYGKVNSSEDAEDLAQDITMEVVKSVYAGKKIENLNAFVWSVSNHTFFKWLRSKKRGNTTYLTELIASPDNTEEAYLLQEQTSILRREIALLSENYRKTVVLYYFDGRKCEEIAQILGKSTGTIKWWLHDARNSIKEGMDLMREYGEKSYRPGKLFVSCQGAPGLGDEPLSCAKRLSAQNILLAAYQKPMTMEELSLELGVSAPYIEDEVKYLCDNQLMNEVSTGRYQTDFVILPGQNVGMADQIYESCIADYDKMLMTFLEKQKTLLSGAEFNTAEFTWNRLLWVYIHIFTDRMIQRYRAEECHAVYGEAVPVRPNGGQWIALGYEDGTFSETQPEWKEYQPSDGPVHNISHAFAQGFFHTWSGLDSNVFFDLPDGIFELCNQIVKKELQVQDLDEKQKYLFSVAVEKKLFLKNNDGFQQNYYFINHPGFEKIMRMADDFYKEAQPLFKKAYDLVLKKYGAGVPKHLRWQMGNFLSNYLAVFVTGTLYEEMNHGSLSQPDENNREWLSLFVSEF